MTMATVALSLGVFGGLARFAISHSEKQEKAKRKANRQNMKLKNNKKKQNYIKK